MSKFIWQKGGVILTLLFCLSSIIIISSATCAEALTQDPETEYGWVEYLFREGENSLAVNAGLRFIYLFPYHRLSDDVRIIIGKSYFKDTKYDKAIEIFEGLSKGANSQIIREEAELWLCNTLFKQGNYPEARRRCEEFPLRFPHSQLKDRVQYLKGWSFLKEWKWEDAERAFEEIDLESRFFEQALGLIKETRELAHLNKKSPFTAGILSAIIPGSGYIYTGKWRTGIMALLVNAVFIGTTIECFEKGLPVLGSVIGLVETGWYSGTIYGSANEARHYNYRIREGKISSLSQRFTISIFEIKF